MRGVRIAAASMVASVTLAVTLGVPTGSASADSTSVPGSLSTVAQRTGPITLVVPAGTTPSAVTGVLSMPQVVPGSIVTLLVNGRIAAQVPSTLYTKVSVPVSAADVLADGTLTLSLRYDAPPGTTGCAPPPEISLRKLGLDYTGVETAPESVATFFPAQAARIDVKVAPDAGDDVLAAALNAVAALSARYPADTPVELSTTAEPLATLGAGQRVVSLVGSGEDVTTTVTADFGVPTLVLAGSGLPLAEAAAGLSGRPVRPEPSLTRTLDELNRATPTVSGPAPGTSETEIRPDSFGGPVSALKIHLEGTHSAVPEGADARLDVYFNNELIDSSTIGADPRVDLDVQVPGSRLRSTNTLRATVTAAAASSDPAIAAPTTVAPTGCSPGLPLELALDGERSTVTATRGVGDPGGFQVFPQALRGRLPVAIRQSGETRIDGAIDAAHLISSLQRSASAPLAVTLVDPDLFVAGAGSGLIVGADEADSIALGAPLRLSGTRLSGTDAATFAVADDTPFASLETVVQKGRSILMLGSWAPGDTVAVPSLSHRVTERVVDLGWAGVDGDVLILAGGGSPYTVDSGTPFTTAEPVSEENSYLTYVLIAVGALLALLALLLLRALRRDRPAAPPIGSDPVDPLDPEVDLDDDPGEDLDDESEVQPDAAALAVTLSHGRQPWVKLRRE